MQTGLAVALFALLSAALPATGRAGTAAGDGAGEEMVGLDTSIGRVEYRPGRGLHFGDTSLTIGGFVTAEASRLEDGESRGGLEGANFLVTLDPTPYLHLFAELSEGPIAVAENGSKGVQSGSGLDVDRLYVDAGNSDALNLRIGTFFTPIGRWNQAPADPFLWTTSEPLIVEGVFDETVKGAMLWGRWFPRGGALTYSLFGTFFDPVTHAPDTPEADQGVGARLEWANLEGWSLGASYVASDLPRKGWNHVAGVDGVWQPSARLELSAEALFRESRHRKDSLWGLYAQAVVETVPTLYAVGRYERFDPPGDGSDVDLFDIGLTWIPAYYLRLKADYRFADTSTDLSAAGFQASFSLLF